MLLNCFLTPLSGHTDDVLPVALAALINSVTVNAGQSWRVGVGCITAEHQARLKEQEAAAAAAAAAAKRVVLRQASTKNKSKPAVMTVSKGTRVSCRN